MAKNLTMVLENRPGTLAELGEALGKAGINIDGLTATTDGEAGQVHILVEDGAAAQEALKAAGIEVSGQRDVLVMNVDDKPGALGELSRKIADAGVNIDLLYVASDSRIVLAADDLDKAAAAI